VILVDTSVWVDPLRRGDAGLVSALERTSVLMHPFVVGDLDPRQTAGRDRPATGLRVRGQHGPLSLQQAPLLQ
jgi:hypothetical protein